MKIIDDFVRKALMKLADSCGTKVKTGQALGISDKHVGQILAGNVNYLNDRTWQKIEPILEPYFPEEEPPDPQHKFILDNLKYMTDEDIQRITTVMIKSGKLP